MSVIKRMSGLEKKYVARVIDNEFRTSLNNVFVSKLEAKFADRVNRKYAVSFANGTATLHTALAALGVKPGDEVIVPPLTMASTSLAVLHNRSVPVFADVDRRTFNISPDAVKSVITPKTKAIISVALYGLLPDYEGLRDICKKKKIYLIEDDAEAFDATYKGKVAGEFGEFSSYSFQASKHLTCGEGGMLATQDEALADKARRFCSLGYGSVSAKKGKITRTEIQDPNFSRHVCLGWNYRMSELQAAVALGQLDRSKELIAARRYAASLFGKVIRNEEWLIPQQEPEGFKNSYWSYSVVLNVDKPGERWYQFRDLFAKYGGDGIYAAWKLTYQEPYFVNEVQRYKGVWQKFYGGLCSTAEYLQRRMLQFKTNYWDRREAERQAEVLSKTVKEFKRRYL